MLITSRKANKVKLADQLRCYLRVHACLPNIEYSGHVHFIQCRCSFVNSGNFGLSNSGGKLRKLKLSLFLSLIRKIEKKLVFGFPLGKVLDNVSTESVLMGGKRGYPEDNP